MHKKNTKMISGILQYLSYPGDEGEPIFERLADLPLGEWFTELADLGREEDDIFKHADKEKR